MSPDATPAECLAEAFRLLSRGVADRRSAFHTVTLATVGPDGAPEARTLVLRGFEPATRTIRLHSDSRSAKVTALEADPRCVIHLYDAPAKIQLRLSGRAALHRSDALADAAWAASRDAARMVYAVQPAPGTAVAAPPVAPQDPVAGRAWFALLLVRVDRLEWLELAASGHRRARFAWTGDSPAEASWLVP